MTTSGQKEFERIPVLRNAAGEIAIVFPQGRAPLPDGVSIGAFGLTIDRGNGALLREDGASTGFALATDAHDLFRHPRRCMALAINDAGERVFLGWVVLE